MILRENFLNVARTQCFTHVKRVSQHSAESRGFSPGAPVSSHRKVDRLKVIITLDVIGHNVSLQILVGRKHAVVLTSGSSDENIDIIE